MTEFQLGTFAATLAMLFNKGVRYRTVIDLGCADGHFYLDSFHDGLLPGTVCLNVDANSMYEPSLKRIQQVLGGHYTFAAVSDRDGEIELQMGSHHYWASTLPSDAPYWTGANRPGEIVKVRAATLDTLVQEFALKPPFLLKLDIQGGELEALRGGRKMLAETDTIICESEPVAFMSVCEFLRSHDFKVIDFTHMFRLNDGVLAEFYPVFLNNRVKYETVDPWTAGIASLVSQMESRRANILDRNAKILADLQAKQVPSRPV